MAKSGFVAVLLCLLPLAVRSQSSHVELTLSPEYMLTAYDFQSPDNIVCGSIEATWWSRVPDADWKYAYPQPLFGVMADWSVSPHSICGYRFGLAGKMRTPLTSWLDWDVGLGAAGFTKPANLPGDTNNVYITTPLTFLIGTSLSVRCSERLRLSLGLLHTSNGALRLPNRGLNYFQLGLTYALTRPTSVSSVPLTEPVENFLPYHALGFTLSPGLVAARHSSQQGLFLCYDLSLNYEYHHSPRVAYGATVDFWYNFSHREQVIWYHDDYTAPVYVSMLAFVEGFWGPLSIKAGMGPVLAASSRVGIPFYERVALYYNFGHNYVGIGINAHAGQAEFVEWSYGHRFRLPSRPSTLSSRP